MSEHRYRINLSRRRFLKTGGLAASGLLLGCGSGKKGSATDVGQADSGPDFVSDADNADSGGGIAPGTVVLGLYPALDGVAARNSVRQVCTALDWAWLSPGDSVFLKLSCNSPNAHPAVTSPNVVAAIVAELAERGAGEVLVGDQAGVETVRLMEGDVLVGSTRQAMQSNGLLAAIEESGGMPHFFDEQGYETGYFPAAMDMPDCHWKSPPRIAEVIRQVDHIITLPRLSSHIIAGYSHGHKAAVGWLRDDSRYQLHFNGSALHEMYTELNYAQEISSRHRLTLTLAESLMLDSGPDQGTVTVADPVLVIASPHMANHDALAVAVLSYIDKLTPPDSPIPMVYGPEADTYNQLLMTMLIPAKYGAPWGDEDMADYSPVEYHEYGKGIAFDRGLKRAYSLLGGVPDEIPVLLAGEVPDPDFLAHLEAYNNGIFRLLQSG